MDRFMTGNFLFVRKALLALFVVSAGYHSLCHDVTFKGRYVYSSYDRKTEKPKNESEAEFLFSRLGDDWKVEVRRNPFFPGFERLQWVYRNGALYRTEFAASRATNVIPRIMAVTTNSLPDFGWHFAVPLLLIFHPGAVLLFDPPSIPRAVFLPPEEGQPERFWCAPVPIDEGSSPPVLLLVKAYGERSVWAPALHPPQKPRDPLLVFESQVLRLSTSPIANIPMEFSFRACYPRPGGTDPDDVITTWKVRGIVVEESITSPSPPLLQVEGFTLVADYRVALPSLPYIGYTTTNSVWGTNSLEFKRILEGHTADLGYRPSVEVKSRLLFVCMVLLTGGTIAALIVMNRKSTKVNTQH
jgi:hypothetical protein